LTRSELDLVLDGLPGSLPIEIKLGLQVGKADLLPLHRFLDNLALLLGLLVNWGERVAQLSDRVVQIPIGWW